MTEGKDVKGGEEMKLILMQKKVTAKEYDVLRLQTDSLLLS
jgi:predicted HTH domain antitoxin